MIRNRIARVAFYFFLSLLFILNVISLFSGINHPEGLNPSGSELSRWSIRLTQERWIVYHVWALIVLGFLGWRIETAKRIISLIDVLVDGFILLSFFRRVTLIHYNLPG